MTVEDKDHAATPGPAGRVAAHRGMVFVRQVAARVRVPGCWSTVDETTYKPVGMFGKDLRMGDHPAVWSRCIGKGRVLYTTFGHRAEAFAEPETSRC